MKDENENSLKVKLLSYTEIGFTDVYGEQVALVITLDVEKSKDVNIEKEDWIFIGINNNKYKDAYATDLNNVKDIFINNNNKKSESIQYRNIDYLYKTILTKYYNLSILDIESEANRFLSKYFKKITTDLDNKTNEQKQFVLLRLISQDMEPSEFTAGSLKDKDLFTNILIGKDLLK